MSTHDSTAVAASRERYKPIRRSNSAGWLHGGSSRIAVILSSEGIGFSFNHSSSTSRELGFHYSPFIAFLL